MAKPVVDNSSISETTSSPLVASPCAGVVELPSEPTLACHSVTHSHEPSEEKKRVRSSHNMLIFDTATIGGNARKRRVRHLSGESTRLFRPFVFNNGVDDAVEMGTGVDDEPFMHHKAANTGESVQRNQLWGRDTSPNVVAGAASAPPFDSVVSDWLPPDGRHQRGSEVSDRITRSTCATSRVASLEAADDSVGARECPTKAALGCGSLGAPQAGAGLSNTRRDGSSRENLDEKEVNRDEGGRNHGEEDVAAPRRKEKTSGFPLTSIARREDPTKAATPSLYDVYVGGDIGLGNVNTGTAQGETADASKGALTIVTSGCRTHNGGARSSNSFSANDSRHTSTQVGFLQNHVTEAHANDASLLGVTDATTVDVDSRPSVRRTLTATEAYEMRRKHEHQRLVISAGESEGGDEQLRKRRWSGGVHADTDAAWARLQEQLLKRASDGQTDSEESNKNGQNSPAASFAQGDTFLSNDAGLSKEEAEARHHSVPLLAEEEDRESSMSHSPSPSSTVDAALATADDQGTDEQVSDSFTTTAGKHERGRNAGSGGGGGGTGAGSTPFYSVSEGAMSKKVILRSHRFYPVIRGVSRDNTKRRWAVYWKGNRKYFYDKFYEDCYQAYLHAVDFRKHAKAHGPLAGSVPPAGLITGPTSPASFLLNFSGPFESAAGSGGATSLLESCSSSASSPATASSLLLSAAERLPRGSRELSSSALADAVLRESTVDDRHSRLNRHAVLPRCAEQTAIPSVDEATFGKGHGAVGHRRASGQTLELYKNAVRLMLQDLSITVAPTFFAAARNRCPEDTEDDSRDEAPRVTGGLQSAGSLSLLQQVLHWHLEHVQKATHQHQVFQFLSILSPCLESTRLPSQSPPNLQQRLLLELLDLHVQQLLVLSKDIYAHFQKQQQQDLLLLLQRVVSHKQQSRSPKQSGTHSEESPFNVTSDP
ncbi:UNVERIFIED_CONTAM: AP2 domain transcription factor AP2VIIa-8 [Hammondia hammondi]|eukprot:XP_008887574.1 AP2 domain transcription factor AP2VIIa-8 [Hammondia hammondi]